jgi:hypothetical protein
MIRSLIEIIALDTNYVNWNAGRHILQDMMREFRVRAMEKGGVKYRKIVREAPHLRLVSVGAR